MKRGRKLNFKEIITMYFEIPLKSLRTQCVRNPKKGTDNYLEFYGSVQRKSGISDGS